MNASEFKKRRKRLAQDMVDGIAVIPTSPVRTRNGDVEYQYRPDSDFYYLTGFSEPESLAIIVAKNGVSEFTLLCRERDPEMETWHGLRAGLEGVIEKHGADQSFSIEEIDDVILSLLENQDKIYYTMGRYPEYDKRVVDWLNQLRARSRSGVRVPGEIVQLDHILHEMRLIKSPAEIKTMRKAANISAAAHTRAMEKCQPGLSETQIEAELLHEFMRNGSRYSAYPSIVGGGKNGCILHYVENNRELKDGDLLLIDAGAEYECYASDITRTFPVNGKFSDEQKALYNIVLDAQLAAIEQVKAGNHWDEPHQAAVRVLTTGLIELGLLDGDVEQLIKDEAYKPFYMHRTGHWLGLDVHDVGDYKIEEEWRLLVPGMVTTVEPGLYIAPDNQDVDERWRGIGIRIEDDVLVTKNGPDILSKGVPKSVAAIEKIMAR